MDMSKLWSLAHESVARGSAFGLLAIICTMVGLAGFPVIALKTGGVMALIGSAILIVKAEFSHRRDYKRTELWTLLEKHERPHAAIAQTVIGGTLREAFYKFGALYAAGGFSCFGVALAWQLVHSVSA